MLQERKRTFFGKTHNFHHHFRENFQSENIKTMTHFAGENWNGNHLPSSAAVYSSGEVPSFPQIWNQEGAAAYNDIIGFQDLGEKKSIFWVVRK